MAKSYEIKINAKDKTKAALKSIKGNLSAVNSKVALITGAVAGLAGIAGFGALIASSLAAGDVLAKTADKIGITTVALSQLQHATSLFTSAGAGAMAEALTKASKRLGEFNANGAGAAGIWLKKLNLDTMELAKLSPDKLFDAYSESIRGLNDRGQQLAAMSALLGDESRQLIGIIDQTPEALADAAREADLLGVSLSRIDAAKMEAANDSMTRIKGLVKGAGNAITTQLAPFIDATATGIKNMALEFGGFKQIAANTLDFLVTAIGFVADAIRGWEFIWAGLKAIFANVVQFIIVGLDDIQNGIVGVINLIPGIDVEPIRDLAIAAAESEQAFAKASMELDAIVNKPMPSDQFAIWAEEVKLKANEAAAAVAAASPANAVPQVPDDAMAAIDEKDAVRVQAKLDRLDLQHATEKEKLLIKLEEEQLILDEAFEVGLISDIEKKDRQALIDQDHQTRLTAINKKGLTARQKFEELSGKAQTRFILSELGNQLSGLTQHSKTAFKLNKVAGIANAIINTAEGVTKSLSAYPFPINVAMAAASFAAGIAQVNTIKSQSFGGGGSAPSPSAGGASAASSALTTATTAIDTTGLTTNETDDVRQSVTINLGDEDELISVSSIRTFLERATDVAEDMGPNTRIVIG